MFSDLKYLHHLSSMDNSQLQIPRRSSATPVSLHPVSNHIHVEWLAYVDSCIALFELQFVMASLLLGLTPFIFGNVAVTTWTPFISGVFVVNTIASAGFSWSYKEYFGRPKVKTTDYALHWLNESKTSWRPTVIMAFPSLATFWTTTLFMSHIFMITIGFAKSSPDGRQPNPDMASPPFLALRLVIMSMILSTYVGCFTWSHWVLRRYIRDSSTNRICDGVCGAQAERGLTTTV